VRRLRPLSEAECYTRCYGGWEQTVRVVLVERPPRRDFGSVLSGEAVRRLFEGRLELREPEVEPEAA
jgi:hypothetical protein